MRFGSSMRASVRGLLVDICSKQFTCWYCKCENNNSNIQYVRSILRQSSMLFHMTGVLDESVDRALKMIQTDQAYRGLEILPA